MNWINEIKNYIPYNDQEKADKYNIIEAINKHNNLLTRENKVMHITSSGYIVNKTKDKVLMIYHKIYNSWSWTGGHADGDEDLLYVAIKEAKEETGLEVVTPISNKIFSLDILPVNGHFKNGSFVSSHLHLSVAYLLEADENHTLTINEEETNGVKWIPIDEINIHCSEADMIKLYEKFNEKISTLRNIY
ncbi:NUDIX hydrolase [Clostridium paraputrificum]|uniref:NUDIX hydrolase n=1 Tax=Clostridium TaxID=1485 RepID=UPI003D33DF9D